MPEPKNRSYVQLDTLFERRISARKFASTDVAMEIELDEVSVKLAESRNGSRSGSDSDALRLGEENGGDAAVEGNQTPAATAVPAARV